MKTITGPGIRFGARPRVSRASVRPRRAATRLAAGILAVLALALPAALAAQEAQVPAEAQAAVQPGATSMVRPMGPDRSREYYEEGRRLFEARLFGQSLASFQAAVAERSDQYLQAKARIEAVTSQKDLGKAKDSISAIVKLLAQRDLIDADIAKIEADASGSLRSEAGLLLGRRLSADFEYFLKALTLVLDRREASTLRNSLSALGKACDELSCFPEAEYWIGKVYSAEAEPRLAELQYKRAWDERAALEIPDERFDILQDLADLYRSQKSWYSYGECLEKAVAEDPLFGEKQDFLRAAMERALGQQGFDRFYGLYHASYGPWTRAERDLGSFYLDNGRPQALIHLAVAVNSVLSRCAARIAERDSSWEYGGLAGLLEKIEADRELAAFARSTGLYESLQRLGLALERSGYRESAREVWGVLAAMKGIEPWNRGAAQALAAIKGR